MQMLLAGMLITLEDCQEIHHDSNTQSEQRKAEGEERERQKHTEKESQDQGVQVI